MVFEDCCENIAVVKHINLWREGNMRVLLRGFLICFKIQKILNDGYLCLLTEDWNKSFVDVPLYSRYLHIHVPPYKHRWLLSYLEGHRSSASSDSRSEPQGHPVSSDELKTWWNSSSPEELDDFRFFLLSFGPLIT